MLYCINYIYYKVLKTQNNVLTKQNQPFNGYNNRLAVIHIAAWSLKVPNSQLE